MLRELFEKAYSRKIIGFDTFSEFPEPEYEPDKAKLASWLEAAGNKSISREQLLKVLAHKGICTGIELIEGDIRETIPEYLEKNPGLRISLLNLDTDIYEPAKVILEHLYPRIVPGEILILDDYGVYPGENKAVEEYFSGKKIDLQKMPFAMTPCYLIKNDF
ncbi:TylF/MycF/NovP-related O-methyltransferase [uncultured Desulfobacter sp.]|uniref:TylF/MycF/NovP-related O-methyltransferase n=1 Tax=uncultured Desulfobacter sp. TaxID=240139 RepID=UPI002AAAB761|nr:TylF/MycF/NovP-related O-methyltransferase [uncultured Desulfobacter sp.]